MVDTGEIDGAEVIRLELTLLEPACRADSAYVASVLHPDFVEFGSSGTVWDVPGVIAALAKDPGQVAPATEDVRVSVAGVDAILLTYRTARSLRSSLWVRLDGRWLLRFHQGTLLPT